MKLVRIKFDSPKEMYEHVVEKYNDIWDGKERLVYRVNYYAMGYTMTTLNDVADALANYDRVTYTYYLDEDYSGKSYILANCNNGLDEKEKNEFYLAPTFQFCVNEYKKIWWEVQEEASDGQFLDMPVKKSFSDDDIPF